MNYLGSLSAMIALFSCSIIYMYMSGEPRALLSIKIVYSICSYLLLQVKLAHYIYNEFGSFGPWVTVRSGFLFCFFFWGVLIIRIRKTLLESEVIKLVLHEVDSPKFARQWEISNSVYGSSRADLLYFYANDSTILPIYHLNPIYMFIAYDGL